MGTPKLESSLSTMDTFSHIAGATATLAAHLMWGAAPGGLPTRVVDGCVQGVASGVAQSTTNGMFTHVVPAIKGAGIALAKLSLPACYVVHTATVSEGIAAAARTKASEALGAYHDLRKQIRTHADATNKTVTDLTKRADEAHHYCIVDAAHFMMPKYLKTLSGMTYYGCAASYYVPWFTPRHFYTKHLFTGKTSWDETQHPERKPLDLHGTHLHALFGDCYPSNSFRAWTTHLDKHCTINADSVRQDMNALAAAEDKSHSKEMEDHLAVVSKKATDTKFALVDPKHDAKQDDHKVAWWWIVPWNAVIIYWTLTLTRESYRAWPVFAFMLWYASFMTSHYMTCYVSTWMFCVFFSVVRACREYPVANTPPQDQNQNQKPKRPPPPHPDERMRTRSCNAAPDPAAVDAEVEAALRRARRRAN